MTNNNAENRHCMICEKVYHAKTKKWIDKTLWHDIGMGNYTTGIYHPNCADTYLTQYIPTVPNIDKTKIKNALYNRIAEQYL